MDLHGWLNKDRKRILIKKYGEIRLIRVIRVLKKLTLLLTTTYKQQIIYGKNC